MGALLKRRQFTGLIVGLAMLLQWIAPVWASNVAGPATVWASEVCRSSPAKAPPAPHSLKHCLYCASSSDHLAPPAIPAALPLIAPNCSGADAPANVAIHPTPHWHPAQPRAPPTVS